jgi:homoserine O-acetyltransferase
MTHGTIASEERDGFATDLGPGLGRTRTERVVLFPEDDPLVLDNGARLGPVEVAYETYGTLDADGANAVVICHALTGDAHAAGHEGDPARRGWWDVLIGPGRAVDTDRHFVVSANLLGGCRGTTGPSSTDPATGEAYGLDFPALSVGDLVRVQRALVRHLGIRRVAAVVGGSLGGMQALEWALTAPEEVGRAVIVCASARLSAQNIALSTAAREGILRDPDFLDGRYPGTGRIPRAGLAAARMLGHVTYVSEEALETKFGRRRRPDPAGERADEPGGALPGDGPGSPRSGAGTPGPGAADGDARPRPARDGHDWFAPSFELEHYLHHQAESFLERFDALSYLYLTKVMDDFAPFEAPDAPARLARTRDAGTRFLVETFSSDWRFGPEHGDRIADALAGAGVPVKRRDVRSPWGHDSFLLPLREHLDAVGGFLAS